MKFSTLCVLIFLIIGDAETTRSLGWPIDVNFHNNYNKINMQPLCLILLVD